AMAVPCPPSLSVTVRPTDNVPVAVNVWVMLKGIVVKENVWGDEPSPQSTTSVKMFWGPGSAMVALRVAWPPSRIDGVMLTFCRVGGTLLGAGGTLWPDGDAVPCPPP